MIPSEKGRSRVGSASVLGMPDLWMKRRKVWDHKGACGFGTSFGAMPDSYGLESYAPTIDGGMVMLTISKDTRSSSLPQSFANGAMTPGSLS